MILYTQDCLVSVIFCVRLLLVPFCSMCFHLQISEMVIVVTIAVANVVFYLLGNGIARAVSSYEFLVFFCVSSLLSIVTKTGNNYKPPQTSTNDHKPPANDHKPPVNDHR